MSHISHLRGFEVLPRRYGLNAHRVLKVLDGAAGNQRRPGFEISARMVEGGGGAGRALNRVRSRIEAAAPAPLRLVVPIVEPIHPKAMPVILTTEEERDVWMRAMGRGEGIATAIAR